MFCHADLVCLCLHPVAIMNAVFCVTCSLLMSRLEEEFSRAGHMTALWVAISVSFCCLP